MKEEKDDYYKLSDIFVFAKQVYLSLRRRWVGLMLSIMAGLAIGALLYFTQKPKYEADCTFLLEEKQSVGGLGSIASQFGIDIGGLSAGGSLFSGDNILDILRSRKVLYNVLLSPVSGNDSNTTLADVYIEHAQLKKAWESKPGLKDIRLNLTSIKERRHDSLMNIVYDNMVKKHLAVERVNKRGTIIRVNVNSTNPLLPKLMPERLVAEASRLYMEVKVGTAEANIHRMQRRSDSLLALLNSRSFIAAARPSLDANPGIKSEIAAVEIAVRDKNVIAALYTETIKNLETSKMILSQQTPVIQILDSPGISLYDNRKGIVFFLVVSAFVTTFLFTSFVGMRVILNKY